MNLFRITSNSKENLLPFDGIVTYHGRIFNQKESHYYFEKLMNNIAWEQEHVFMFGKSLTIARKVAWYGDKAYQYTYSKTSKHALIWTKELAELKAIVEKTTGDSFNSCLLNLYHNGNEGMGWHSDNENTIVNNSTIASLSFGAERKFSFKHKEKLEKREIILENGSLLSMKNETQKFWLHQLPKSKKVTQPRINLTFRKMVE